MADLCSIESITQDISWERSLSAPVSQAFCAVTTAEPKVKISQLQVNAEKNHSFLRLLQIMTKVHVPEQLVLPQAMWLFYLAVGFRGATLSPAAAGLNCFLPLIKEIKVTQHRFSWNPCVKLFPWACSPLIELLCQTLLRLLHCSLHAVNQSQLPVHTGRLCKDKYAIKVFN